MDPKSQSSSQLYFCECHGDREAAPLPTLLLATLGFCEFRPFAAFRLSCPWQHTLEPGNWSGGRQEGVVGSVMNLKGPAWPRCLQMLIKAAQNSQGWRPMCCPSPLLASSLFVLETRACGQEEGAALQPQAAVALEWG